MVGAVHNTPRVSAASRRGGRVGASRRRDASRRDDSDSSGAPEEGVGSQRGRERTLGKVKRTDRLVENHFVRFPIPPIFTGHDFSLHRNQSLLRRNRRSIILTKTRFCALKITEI